MKSSDLPPQPNNKDSNALNETRDSSPPGGNRPRHLRIPGGTADVAGAAQPVSHPHGRAAGADAAARHAPTHAASRCADPRRAGAECHHPEPGDHLLVLHPEAAGEHAQEPHCHGGNASEFEKRLLLSLLVFTSTLSVKNFTV